MNEKPESTSRRLLKRAVQAKHLYILAAVATLVSAACFIGFCWHLATFADNWLTYKFIQPTELLYATALLTGRYIFAHFASLLNHRAGCVIVSKIKKQLYPILLHNDQRDSISSTLLITKLSDDLKPFYSNFIPAAGASVLVSLLILIVCALTEKWVAAILLISLVVIPMQMMVIGMGADSFHRKHIDLFIKYSAVFYNRLHAIAEIVNLDNFTPQYHFLSRKSKELNKATTDVMRIAVLSSAVLELFVTLSIAAIAIYLGMSLLGIMPGPAYAAGYNFRTALFLLTLSPYFFFYIRRFVSAYHDKTRALEAAKPIFETLNAPSNATPPNVDEALSRFTISDLSFSYPGTSTKVLHQININMTTKGLVLVKGISGSGKSTLLKLCTSSLFPQSGSVSINEKDNLWSHQWLRANTSYMNQYPFIFDGTLHYNVFLDKDTNGANEQSPDLGFLNKILAKKPLGWQTELTHGGKQLSGGERQLVTLARMLLHPKPVAILDEPTASLDTETTETILEVIRKLAQDRLVIVASHEERFNAMAHTTLHLNQGEQRTDE